MSSFMDLGITELSIEFIKNNPDKINYYDIRLLIEFIDNAEMCSTVLNYCKEAVQQYYDTYNELILIYALKKKKKFAVIKEILSAEKYRLNEMSKNSPLEVAETLDVVKLLIENGANVDHFRATDHFTVLMAAIECKKDKEIVLDLIRSSSNVDLTNKSYQTALHLALLFKYDKDVIWEICDKAKNFNVRDKEKLTPLCYALEVNNGTRDRYKCSNAYKSIEPYNKEFIVELIRKGFVVDKMVFLHALSYCNNVEIIDELIKYFNYKFIDSQGNSLLHYVYDVKQVNFLIRKGLPVNWLNSERMSPIMQAIFSKKSFNLIESFLFWGADPDHLLIYCDQHGCYQLSSTPRLFLDLFLIYGLNVSIKNKLVEKLMPNLIKPLNYINYKWFRWLALYLELFKHVYINNLNLEIEDADLNKFGHLNLQKFNLELNKMKEKNIIKNVSFYDFCTKKFKSRNCHIKASNCIFVNNNYSEIKKLFPIFCYDVIVKIRINYKLQNRSRLLNKLSNVCCFTQSDTHSDDNGAIDNSLRDSFGLNSDCLYLIGHYLQDRDINSLLAAAIKK